MTPQKIYGHHDQRVIDQLERERKRFGSLRLNRQEKLTGRQLKPRLASQGIELRGGAADEAPLAYKRLPDVLAEHEGTIHIKNFLTPIGVAMAGDDIVDPYKD